MAPRKQTSATSSRKTKNNNNTQKEGKKGKKSEPSKLGLEHFFERMTQSSQSSQHINNPPSEVSHPRIQQQESAEQVLKPEPGVRTRSSQNKDSNKSKKEGSTTPEDNKSLLRNRSSLHSDPAELEEESPPAKASNKTLRFSPSMDNFKSKLSYMTEKMIKQTQDDGGEEITYNKTPVMERLQSLRRKRNGTETEAAVHQFSNPLEEQDMNRILLNASILNCTPVKEGSEEKISSSKAAIYEQLFSSPAIKSCAQRSQLMSIVEDPRISDGDKENGLTCRNAKIKTRSKKGYFKENRIKGQKKALDLLELINTAEDAMRDEKPSLKKLCSHAVENMNDSSLSVAVHNLKKIINNQPLDENALVSSLVSNTSTSSEQSIVDFNVIEQSLQAEADMDSNVDLNLIASVHNQWQKIHFVVLEVTEMEYYESKPGKVSPCKLLRLLNEENVSEQIVYLCDEWAYSEVRPGDTVNVIGDFDDTRRCIVDNDKNVVIVHPDLLVSGTRISNSFSCLRRAVLDERFKSVEVSAVALMGTMLHQVFQAGLVHELPTKELLEEESRKVILKHIDSIYAIGGDEKEVFSKLSTEIPVILNWIDNFKGKSNSKIPTVDFGRKEEEKQVIISEVVDIEEMVWSPKYGLKGMFDASVRVKSGIEGHLSDCSVMPLEIKTGKGTTGQASIDHHAQVILYNLLMSERYLQDLGPGLIYYLQKNQTQGVAVQRADIVGIIMQRNRYASNFLNASSTQSLPAMLKSYSMCKGCRHLEICSIYHKAHEAGNSETSGLGELFDYNVSHLNVAALDFLRHWDRLIDLEAKDLQMASSEIWRKPSSLREKEGNCLSLMVLDQLQSYPKFHNENHDQYIYSFSRQNITSRKRQYFEMQNERVQSINSLSHSKTLTHHTFKCGDNVILSTEDGRIAVSRGVVFEITETSVMISLQKQLRMGGSTDDDLSKQVWRIDKDETISSFAIMRFNLLQLFVKSNSDEHCRRLIVDLEPPRFDSGAVLSQDPAVSYVRSVQDINDDQRRAIYKILSAKDYVLIHGMPGTGKTSTMVHAVQALLARGASILLTSYTNSAVDNLLVKLKAQGIDFLRLGRSGAIHRDILDHTITGMGINTVKDLQSKVEQACVVGVTCLGIAHPLLSKKKFDVCIVDEAGQITLPVCVGPLMFARTFVLVGDHYQLPPLVRSAEARENGMGSSLFSRLSEAHPQAVSALQSQYRMCAGVMKLCNALIYGERLRCGSAAVAEARLEVSGWLDVQPVWMRQILDPNRALMFINTDTLPAPESKSRNSVNNPLEASTLLKIINELVKGGVQPNDIGVISPYNSQVNLIRKGAADMMLPTLEVQTIDKYQGRDKDCILVSFVRSNSQLKDTGLSLLSDWHRINVAITRAKKKMILIGSQNTLSAIPYLKLMIQEIEEDQGIFHLPKEVVPSQRIKRCTRS